VGLTNGVLTGNGSGITNVSASLPSATASLTITNLTVGAPIVYTGGTPTLTTNAAMCTAASLDSNANNSRFIITFTIGTGVTFTKFLTINLSGTPPSTNPVYAVMTCCSNAAAAYQSVASTQIISTSSNSISIGSGSVATAAATYSFMVSVFR
jgi:hypothetical protein